MHSPTEACYLETGGRQLRIWDLPALARDAGVALDAVPFAAKVLLEALLRGGEYESALTAIGRLASGQPVDTEIGFMPARLIMQDYTGIPSLVDLAAMRDQLAAQGADPRTVNPVLPTLVVVDHSVLIDKAGSADARDWNEAQEMRRNAERYTFLRWAEDAFDNVQIVPPGQGIVHQINLERVTRVVMQCSVDGVAALIPDTVIGTDSHTTMVNGLGVLGWGVGGLEAEAIMLGLPVRTRVPALVGVRLHGQRRPGVGASDLALALTAFLREAGVVGALLEFCGPGLDQLHAADRCTIANMAPEYGAMGAFFPIDAETLRYLRQTGRSSADCALVEAYCARQGMLRTAHAPQPCFGRLLEFELGSVGITLAGPSQPHQRLALPELGASFARRLQGQAPVPAGAPMAHGDIAIAAITSCTSTSNPHAMLAAGLLAKRAVALGLRVSPRIKTSLAPGSTAVTAYLQSAGLLEPLQQLGFHIVGYGCTTCNGGGGDLLADARAAAEAGVLLASVLSGNRNYEGRVHPAIRANYLASPALVVALAIAGTVDIDLTRTPLGHAADGQPVFLDALLAPDAEIDALAARCLRADIFLTPVQASPAWRALPLKPSACYSWEADSTYIQRPPYFEPQERRRNWPLQGARALLALGDDISTDHISPVGAIGSASLAGTYLARQGVTPESLNTFGSRRSNHKVMARGAFANERLVNLLAPGADGGQTRHQGDGTLMPVHAAAERYRAEGSMMIVLAGERYGVGSSRDWAARGPWCLGVSAVLAQSYERIHRSNLIAMGIAPFELAQGWQQSGIDGSETFDLEPGAGQRAAVGLALRIRASHPQRKPVYLDAVLRIDSLAELAIFEHGGMLPYLLARLRGAVVAAAA
ncbi:MAG TPA: aconitate hydratase AcnA [Telluria sp.]|jgi:aconitate hydratase